MENHWSCETVRWSHRMQFRPVIIRARRIRALSLRKKTGVPPCDLDSTLSISWDVTDAAVINATNI